MRPIAVRAFVVWAAGTTGLTGCGPSASERLEVELKCKAALEARWGEYHTVTANYSFKDRACYGLLKAIARREVALVDGATNDILAFTVWSPDGRTKTGGRYSRGTMTEVSTDLKEVEAYIDAAMTRE
jgi:hypothetical protein